MKVVIENSVKDLELQQQIMLIVDKATTLSNLNELYNEINFLDFVNHINSNIVEFGMSGSHIWVSIKGKRILLITD